MNVLRLISQLISIETLRLTYIYKYTGTEIFYSNGKTKTITKTVLITLNKSFVICELYLWHMKNFEIKRQKVPTLNEIPGSTPTCQTVPIPSNKICLILLVFSSYLRGHKSSFLLFCGRRFASSSLLCLACLIVQN